jgi:regulator of protease activity HflC (stomatin/prohibitin superfamily)
MMSQNLHDSLLSGAMVGTAPAMQHQPDRSRRGLAGFLASLAVVLLLLAIVNITTGVTALAPELVPLGVFGAFWAVTCGLSAAAVAFRPPGSWKKEHLEAVPMLRPGLGVVFATASLWAAIGAPAGNSFDAPSYLALLPPLLLAAFGALLSRHFGTFGVELLPEGPGLARWARLAAWLGGISLLSDSARHWDPLASWGSAAVWVVALTTFGVAVDAARMDLAGWATDTQAAFPLTELASVYALAHRANPISSVLDTLDSFLGVDLRGSWALRVVRRGAEPLAVAALFVGWLATSLTQVKLYEEGVLVRLGRISDRSLAPGLHVHLPWPIDEVRRVPTARVMSVAIGNAEEEDPDRENVLWAQRHESTEYTFLLGNGRDLVTIDARLRYRIRDLAAWLTVSTEPAEVLRAVVHAAVTRRTVDRSLDQVLSENMESFTRDVTAAVQADADRLGLGVSVIGMTIGGMHPPVDVAAEYEAVVSAQIARDTLMLDAHATAASDIPAAEADALDTTSGAESEAIGKLAAAHGDAAAFLGVRASYEAEPQLYQYRRRLETLEANLPGRRMVIVDDRLERDGASLWLNE